MFPKHSHWPDFSQAEERQFQNQPDFETGGFKTGSRLNPMFRYLY
jgi:hypothetical protein